MRKNKGSAVSASRGPPSTRMTSTEAGAAASAVESPSSLSGTATGFSHVVIDIDELEKSDLENQIGVFENKIEMLKEKAKALLDRAKNSETHIEQLPDITMRFAEIQERFRR